MDTAAFRSLRDLAPGAPSTVDWNAIEEAAEFAREKHGSQLRDDGATPYINHPMGVALLLARIGGVWDTATLVAAILHDTLEDTDATEDELVARFGPTVTGYVKECTDAPGLPSEERKRRQYEAVSGMSTSAKLVKLADKLFNITDLIEHPPKDWDPERKRNYVRWARRITDRIRNTNAALDAALDAAFEKAYAVLAM